MQGSARIFLRCAENKADSLGAAGGIRIMVSELIKSRHVPSVRHTSYGSSIECSIASL